MLEELFLRGSINQDIIYIDIADIIDQSSQNCIRHLGLEKKGAPLSPIGTRQCHILSRIYRVLALVVTLCEIKGCKELRTCTPSLANISFIFGRGQPLLVLASLRAR